jgi:valyl-tRNA synthetase
VIDKKLANEDFTSRAPQNIVDSEKAKKAEVEEKIRKIEERLKILG